MRSFAARSLIAVLTVLLLASTADAGRGRVVAPGDLAPDTRGRDHRNDLHIVDFTANELTVINFWATWCEPCRDEIPALQELHSTLGELGVKIFGITHERIDDETLGEFLDDMGVTYPVFKAGPSVRRGWVGVTGTLPNTYLVGKNGRVIRRYVGASQVQIKGLVNDVVATLEGRPLGPLIHGGQDGIATPADHKRQLEEEKARKEAEEADGR